LALRFGLSALAALVEEMRDRKEVRRIMGIYIVGDVMEEDVIGSG
jgi:hypothetical protein